MGVQMSSSPVLIAVLLHTLIPSTKTGGVLKCVRWLWTTLYMLAVNCVLDQVVFNVESSVIVLLYLSIE
jgi:hypothetical protein